eukprot:TRINITY_DN696_c0_g3_i3.p2 TRINITY_DN696_c0_g3~~TRINITY_DN696_c0_g3_i3.p2  ORF type:complete len:129 (+),score=12.88 TRINITY_DN696_c0_g3_i3:81-467(+)
MPVSLRLATRSILLFHTRRDREELCTTLGQNVHVGGESCDHPSKWRVELVWRSNGNSEIGMYRRATCSDGETKTSNGESSFVKRMQEPLCIGFFLLFRRMCVCVCMSMLLCSADDLVVLVIDGCVLHK